MSGGIDELELAGAERDNDPGVDRETSISASSINFTTSLAFSSRMIPT